MQKFSIYLAAIVTLALGASSCTKNDTNQTDAEKKQIILAVENATLPVVDQSENEAGIAVLVNGKNGLAAAAAFYDYMTDPTTLQVGIKPSKDTTAIVPLNDMEVVARGIAMSVISQEHAELLNSVASSLPAAEKSAEPVSDDRIFLVDIDELLKSKQESHTFAGLTSAVYTLEEVKAILESLLDHNFLALTITDTGAVAMNGIMSVQEIPTDNEGNRNIMNRYGFRLLYTMKAGFDASFWQGFPAQAISN